MRRQMKICGNVRLREFGPLPFKAVRKVMVADGLARTTINDRMQVVKQAVRWAVENELSTPDVYLAPYAAQVRWLREHCDFDELEIDTVDGFQGREKEAVLISCVRPNRNGEIGFLADTRRMNVALTRARRKLIVVGDSATLGGHGFYAALLSYFESIAAYRSVWEEKVDD